jgi:hypothetical protein
MQLEASRCLPPFAILGILMFATPCAAECPSAAEAGVSLVSTDGRTKLRISEASAKGVVIQTFVKGALQTTIDYHLGLFPLRSRHAKGTTIYEYARPYEHFAFRVGESINFAVLIKTPGQPDILNTINMHVAGQDRVQIGECTYPVFVIERSIRSTDERSSGVVLAYFSEKLKLPLRTRIRFKDGRQQDFAFASIVRD